VGSAVTSTRVRSQSKTVTLFARFMAVTLLGLHFPKIRFLIVRRLAVMRVFAGIVSAASPLDGGPSRWPTLGG
jgi:hypothetical protein